MSSRSHVSFPYVIVKSNGCSQPTMLNVQCLTCARVGRGPPVHAIAGLRWEVDHPGGLGVLASVLIVSLVLVPLCALFSGVPAASKNSLCCLPSSVH